MYIISVLQLGRVEKGRENLRFSDLRFFLQTSNGLRKLQHDIVQRQNKISIHGLHQNDFTIMTDSPKKYLHIRVRLPWFAALGLCPTSSLYDISKYYSNRISDIRDRLFV